MANDVIKDIVEVDELREETEITYTPAILALTKTEEHPIDVDVVNLKSLDLSTSSVNPKVLTEGQTEVHHIKVGEKKSTFYIVIRGNKIYQSGLRGRNQLSKVHNDVIFEYSKIWDKAAMNGANGNNGIFGTKDKNAVLKDSVAISNVNGLVEALTDIKLDMENLGSQDILIYVYGRALQKYLGSLTSSQETPLLKVLEEAYPGATFVNVPTEVSPANLNGFVVIARNLVTLHTSVYPDVQNTGYNDENNYEWANYIMGSTHVSVDKKGALVNQPITLS